MILVIDNYDSFTYNLVQAFGSMGAELIVRRNDEITPREVEGLRPKGIIISPGPGSPSRAGVSCDIIAAYAGRIPILGVSLGHHCVGAAYGARVMPASKVMHGKTAEVHHDGSALYEGIPSPFTATCYHAKVLDPKTLPPILEVTARTEEGEIMGVRHRLLDVEGVQFHPESILTPVGHRLLANFFRRVVRAARPA